MDGDGPVADLWWYPSYAADGDGSSLDMFDGHDSSDDLLELLWQVGGGDGGANTGYTPLVSCPLPPPLPTEDAMAALQHPMLSGQDLDDAVCPVASETSMRTTLTAESKGKLPATDGVSGDIKDTNTRSHSGEKRKKTSRGSSSSKDGSSRNKIAEKRRRFKITERLRTLQQLVPGCHESNQASTLEQTIQYMKSLQQHVLQAMNTNPAPAACPVAMLPYPHHYTAMTPTAQWYRPAPGTSAALPYAT